MQPHSLRKQSLKPTFTEQSRTDVDPQLQDQQAGFRGGKSCTGQIETLRIILELSCEWNSSLFVNYIDYEKTFESLDRQPLNC